MPDPLPSIIMANNPPPTAEPTTQASPIPQVSSTPTPAQTLANPPTQGDDASVSMTDFESIMGKTADPSLNVPSKPSATPDPKANEPVKQNLDNSSATPASAAQPANVVPLEQTKPKPADGELPMLDINLINNPQANTNKPVEQVTPPTNIPNDGRDYSGLTQDEVEAFKRMSNESFALAKPKYIEAKKLPQLKAEYDAKIQSYEQKLKDSSNGVVPQQWYEHPASFVLNPQYLQAQQAVGNLDQQERHWQNQLAILREGKAKPRDLIAGQDGNLYAGQELEPSTQIETAIISKISQLAGQKQQLNQFAAGLAQTHQLQHQQAVTTLKQAEDKFFPFFNEDRPEYKAYKPIIDKAKESLPEAFRNHPLANIFGKSWALFLDLQKQLKAKTTNQPAPLDTQVAQPRPNTAPNPTAAPQAKDEANFDDFLKVKQA